MSRIEPISAVLMYHGVSMQPSKEKYDITESVFDWQLQSIARLGFKGVSLHELGSRALGDTSKVVVITFDDGHGSNYERALPLLGKYGFTATFFLTTSWIGNREGYMSWEEVGRLHASGMDIQIHGKTHRFLCGSDRDFLRGEMFDAKADVRREVGLDVDALSFPGGRYSAAALEVAREAGMRWLATSGPGVLRHASLFSHAQIPRMVVHQGISDATFARYVACDRGEISRAHRRYVLGRALKSTVGQGLYQKVWRKMFA